MTASFPLLVAKIVSGGQTGVDRAALDYALACGLPHGGWCPRGRKAEDGVIPDSYRLHQTPHVHYGKRTVWNVVDSHGTLILTRGALTGGTALTLSQAKQHHKPVLVVDLRQPWEPALLRAWLREHEIRVLNVAGPRESENPGIHDAALAFLQQALAP